MPLAPMLALGLQPDLGSPAHAAGEHLLALHGVGKAGSEGGGRSEPTLNAASSIILVHQLEQMPSLGQLQPRLALGAARLGAALALAFALAATLAATTVYTATRSAAPTTAATTAAATWTAATAATAAATTVAWGRRAFTLALVLGAAEGLTLRNRLQAGQIGLLAHRWWRQGPTELGGAARPCSGQGGQFCLQRGLVLLVASGLLLKLSLGGTLRLQHLLSQFTIVASQGLLQPGKQVMTQLCQCVRSPALTGRCLQLRSTGSTLLRVRAVACLRSLLRKCSELTILGT